MPPSSHRKSGDGRPESLSSPLVSFSLSANKRVCCSLNVKAFISVFYHTVRFTHAPVVRSRQRARGGRISESSAPERSKRQCRLVVPDFSAQQGTGDRFVVLHWSAAVMYGRQILVNQLKLVLFCHSCRVLK